MKKDQKKVKGPRSFDDKKFLEKTGKTFKEWKNILDKFDVKKNGHTAASKFLMSEYSSPSWWTQAIIVKYEWEVGLKKELVVPKDFQDLLNKNKKAKERFESLSSSHKKEYVDSILEAKKLETRQRRLEKTIAELLK